MAANFSANFGPYGGRISDHMAAGFQTIWRPIFGQFSAYLAANV
jgi:hypothetical protein